MYTMRYIALIFLFYGCSNFVSKSNSNESKIRKEVFIIPKNYIGSIIVVYNMKCGDSLINNLGDYKYNIPSSGILMTSSQINYDRFKPSFLYQDSLNVEIYLSEIQVSDLAKMENTFEMNKIGVFNIRTGKRHEIKHNINYEYLVFFVGSGNDYLAYFPNEVKKFDDVLLEVKKCLE